MEGRARPDRYHVLREKGTEPAWTGTLLDVHDPGLFRCAGCGAELFRSDDKFDSGSGWPSFTKAVADGVIDEHEDRAFGMRRTEITCARCGGHLGHVFPDGPAPDRLSATASTLSHSTSSPARSSNERLRRRGEWSTADIRRFMSHPLVGDSFYCAPRWCVDALKPPGIPRRVRVRGGMRPTRYSGR